MPHKTFVLVHGAWHGAWSYERVAQRLLGAGHRVYVPTLTGLSERSHLYRPDINLTTHVLDVTNLIRWLDLHEITCQGCHEQVPRRLPRSSVWAAISAAHRLLPVPLDVV